MSVSKAVEAHYNKPQLEQLILEALSRAGHDGQHLKPMDLAPVDEFHLGALESTQAMAPFMKLWPGMHLLDVGCGIGGPARYFAAEHQCRVTGVDLTEQYVRTAENLTRLTGLGDRVSFRRASALELPFEAGSFDGAYMIHVGMNVADKAGVFREVARVLKPGGLFTIYDILRTAEGKLQFPVPWAISEETNFMSDLYTYTEALHSAGFAMKHERRRREFAIEFMQRMVARAAAPPVLGIHLLMGDQAPIMLKNVFAAVQAGIIEPVELVAAR